MTMNRNGLISRKYAAALAVVIAPFVAIGQAEAACNPPGPVNGTVVTCTGATINGYGTANDTDNTINVVSGASLAGGTRVIQQADNLTLNNDGSITATTTTGSGVFVLSKARVFNTNTIAGGSAVNGIGITTGGTLDLTNSGGISGGSFGAATSGTLTASNSGTIQAAAANGEAMVGQTVNLTANTGTISGDAFGVHATATATINNARALQQASQLGSIEPGKVADLVILDADPTRDIRNTRKIQHVIHGGHLCTPAQLLGMVPDR